MSHEPLKQTPAVWHSMVLYDTVQWICSGGGFILDNLYEVNTFPCGYMDILGEGCQIKFGELNTSRCEDESLRV